MFIVTVVQDSEVESEHYWSLNSKCHKSVGTSSKEEEEEKPSAAPPILFYSLSDFTTQITMDTLIGFHEPISRVKMK